MTKVRTLDAARARAALRRLEAEHPELRGSPQVRGAREWLADTETEEETMAEQDEQIVTRAPSALVKRLDAYAERLKAEEPGRRVTRADAIRILLHKALDAVDASEAPKAKGTKAKR